MVAEDGSRQGWVLASILSATSYLWGMDPSRVIIESDNMLLESINPIWLIVALFLAVIVGEVLLYYGKYTSSNAQKSKAIVAAKKAGRPITSEVEKFDLIYVPTLIASAAITFFLGYTVLFDVIPSMTVGFEIMSPAFAGFLIFIISLVFCMLVDYPIHQTANAIRNGGIARAQTVIAMVMSDPEKREKLFQDVSALVTRLGEGVDEADIRCLITEISSRKTRFRKRQRPCICISY